MVSDSDRAFADENALASIRLEGGHIEAETQELADRYAAGELSANDLATYARTGARSRPTWVSVPTARGAPNLARRAGHPLSEPVLIVIDKPDGSRRIPRSSRAGSR